jgi:hypothetical protein
MYEDGKMKKREIDVSTLPLPEGLVVIGRPERRSPFQESKGLHTR